MSLTVLNSLTCLQYFEVVCLTKPSNTVPFVDVWVTDQWLENGN